jgi:hypothetical protein
MAHNASACSFNPGLGNLLMSRRVKIMLETDLDVDWYLSTYPDARKAIEAGHYRDATDHFLRFGLRNGRVPSEPNVDEAWYLEKYPDVAKAIGRGTFESAKIHYARFGYREGRLPSSDYQNHIYASVQEVPHRRLFKIPRVDLYRALRRRLAKPAKSLSAISSVNPRKNNSSEL